MIATKAMKKARKRRRQKANKAAVYLAMRGGLSHELGPTVIHKVLVKDETNSDDSIASKAIKASEQHHQGKRLGKCHQGSGQTKARASSATKVKESCQESTPGTKQSPSHNEPPFGRAYLQVQGLEEVSKRLPEGAW